MAIRSIPDQCSADYWRQQSNLLAQDFGDLSILTTNDKTNLVAAVNELEARISSLIVSGISLPNNSWFTGDANPSGSVNILKVGTDNKIYFGTDVNDINITGGAIASLTTPVPITAGGTGAGSQSGARSALGLAIGTNVQAWDANLDQIAALTPSADSIIIGNSGGTAWEGVSGNTMRTRLGLGIGTAVQAYHVHLASVAAINPAANTFIVGTGNVNTTTAYAAKDPTQVASILGLVIGSTVQSWGVRLDEIKTIAATGNTFIVGEAGAMVGKNPAQVTSILGLVIGTNVQAYSAYLTAMAAATPTANNMLLANGSTWTGATPAQVRSALTLVVGTHVQAWDVNLDQIAALTPTTNSVIIGNSGGTAWENVSGATLQSRIGLAIGSNVQGYSPYLTAIAGLTPTSNTMILANGTTWISVDATTVRNAILAAARGANSDITSLNDVDVMDNNADVFIGPRTNSGLYMKTNNINYAILEASTPSFRPVSPSGLYLGHPSYPWITGYFATLVNIGNNNGVINLSGGNGNIQNVTNITNGANLYIGTVNANALVFRTNNADRWYIDSSGNLQGSANNAYSIGTVNAVNTITTNTLNMSNQGDMWNFYAISITRYMKALQYATVIRGKDGNASVLLLCGGEDDGGWFDGAYIKLCGNSAGAAEGYLEISSGNGALGFIRMYANQGFKVMVNQRTGDDYTFQVGSNDVIAFAHQTVESGSYSASQRWPVSINGVTKYILLD